MRARRAAPLRATMADEAARPPARLPWGAAPPTPPIPDEHAARLWPTHPPSDFFPVGGSAPHAPHGPSPAARSGPSRAHPNPRRPLRSPSPRGKGRAARRRGQRAHGDCEGAATVSRAVRPPLPSRERAGVRGSDARRAKPSMADEAARPPARLPWGAAPTTPTSRTSAAAPLRPVHRHCQSGFQESTGTADATVPEIFLCSGASPWPPPPRKPEVNFDQEPSGLPARPGGQLGSRDR